jgi:hypothetical protein
MNNKMVINKLLTNELALYQAARSNSNSGLCFQHLGRAHVIAQQRWFYHFYVHALMLEYAWDNKNYKEIFGQIIRLVATIPGHLFKKLPTGNVGWSTVGIFQKMAVPEDLKPHLERHELD